MNRFSFKSQEFPEEAGFKSSLTFVLQMHYVNDNLDQNVTDGSGVDIYFTSSLRANTIGSLTVGSEVNWKSLALVPGTTSMTTYFYCYSDCVNVSLNFINAAIMLIIQEAERSISFV